MNITTFGLIAAVSLAGIGSGTAAHAFCSASKADVTVLCPNPAPYPGTKYLTPTSRSLPTVGTPGLYRNWGNGYDVRVYRYQNGTGYQDFQWAVPTDYGKRRH